MEHRNVGPQIRLYASRKSKQELFCKRSDCLQKQLQDKRHQNTSCQKQLQKQLHTNKQLQKTIARQKQLQKTIAKNNCRALGPILPLLEAHDFTTIVTNNPTSYSRICARTQFEFYKIVCP